jgi:hypothetical protein
MRLHFWALREEGLVADCPAFADYYVRFIAHFVSVYERTAPPFAREALRWSADAGNVAAYEATGRMADLDEGKSLADQRQGLPPHERDYTGSSAALLLWPYAM